MVNDDVDLQTLLVSDDEPQHVVHTEIEERITEIDPPKENVFSVDTSAFDLPLRIKQFATSKEYHKFIKNVEMLIRKSHEYHLWVKYLTDNVGDNTCALTKESIHECPLEVHHHPVMMFTIVKAVLDQYLLEGKEFCSFDIATDVIELHFQNKVGYVVLLSDLHSKFHKGFLNLPIELVHGDYKHIITQYSIEEEDLNKIAQYCNVHQEDLKLEWGKNYYPDAIDGEITPDEVLETQEVAKKIS